MDASLVAASSRRGTSPEPRPGHPRAERLRILAPTRYAWTFNGPRASRHRIEHRNFLPLNYVTSRLEGITAFAPLPPARFDLVHAFNRIPLGTAPFVIGFESHMPRCFGAERTRYGRALTALLAGPRCRGIVAMSDHAADLFRRQHQGSEHAAALFSKLSRVYPNVEVSPKGVVESAALDREQKRDGLHLVFVGNHFGRKGGCTAVRVAELAWREKLPITVDIVSTLTVGGSIWTDPVDDAVFEPYKALLALPNVRLRQGLPNPAVKALLAAADLHLLTTLGDTFGYSAIEAMAAGTPVIGTAQGALPEFIAHGVNGILLPLETTTIREWVNLGAADRASPRFARAFTDTVERLALETVAALRQLLDDPAARAGMRERAWATATELFDAGEASTRWDAVYERAVAKRTGQTEKADA